MKKYFMNYQILIYQYDLKNNNKILFNVAMSREPRWCLLVRADSVPDWAVPQSFTTPEVKETGQGEII